MGRGAGDDHWQNARQPSPEFQRPKPLACHWRRRVSPELAPLIRASTWSSYPSCSRALRSHSHKPTPPTPCLPLGPPHQPRASAPHHFSSCPPSPPPAPSSRCHILTPHLPLEAPHQPRVSAPHHGLHLVLIPQQQHTAVVAGHTLSIHKQMEASRDSWSGS